MSAVQSAKGSQDFTMDLIYSSMLGEVASVSDLIQKKANVNCKVAAGIGSKSKPLLLDVCLKSKENPKLLQVMTLLLGAKADVNGKDENGAPILYRVIEQRNIPALRILLDNKVDLNDGKLAIALMFTNLIGKSRESPQDGAIMASMLKGDASSDKKDKEKE